MITKQKITIMIFQLITQIITDASKASNKKLDKAAYADYLNTLSLDDLLFLSNSYKSELV
jgi:hypothetical protein